ncbi:MAG: SlyX family protein [Lentisphaeria bacterium]|nr:SlyX family protein [Lentisphaeria bacterium]
MTSFQYSIRKMTLQDVSEVSEILRHYAKLAVLLWRNEEDIIEHLESFWVLTDTGRVVGCIALQDYGYGLYELRSLAIHKDYQGKGLGKRIVEHAKDYVKGLSGELFALTRKVDFFKKCGFLVVDREKFPQKVWKDCQLCPKKDCCDETTVALDYRNTSQNEVRIEELEDEVADLQVKLSFQDEEIQTLNKELYCQQQEVAQLKLQVDKLKDQFKTLSLSFKEPDQKPPPHY